MTVTTPSRTASTTEILKQLIRFETVSGGSTAAINAFITALCSPAAQATIAAPGPDPSQVNLAFRFGPDTPGGIVLSGHTDVVPVQDQCWTHPPFTATETEGRVYGRGSCDMKGFLAAMIAAVPKLAAANLARPVWLAFTYDEETGCLGAPYLAQEIARQTRGIEAVVVGEPTEMAVVDQHKGAVVEYVTFHGLSAHSSLPWLGLSANEYAVRFAAQLVALKDELAQQAPGGAGDRMSTLNLAQIEGGTAHNIVADKCRVMWSLRCAPGADPGATTARIRAMARALEAEMQQNVPQARVAFETVFDVPPLAADPTSSALRLGLALTGQNAGQMVNYGTEAGVYQAAGLPTIICGPGSIEQAHKPDEWIALDQLDACDRFFEKIIVRQST